MSRKHIYISTAASVGMLILILDSQTALLGARQGLALCLQTIIPSLFPFFLLSVLLTGSLLGSRCPFPNALRLSLGIPHGAESILLTGLLGGYPVGAQAIGQAYQNGHISKEDAEHMLAFSSNAGPAFLFGIVAGMFPEKRYAVLLWGIHIASALLVGLLYPQKHTASPIHISHAPPTLSGALTNALQITAAVCGWIILFRIVLSFLERWILWWFPDEIQVIISGLLELSNGCCQLNAISDRKVRFVCTSGLLAWGGFCVCLQTASVTEGLSLRSYYLGKLLQTLFSILLCCCFLYPRAFPFLLISIILLAKFRKSSSISSAVGVY